MALAEQELAELVTRKPDHRDCELRARVVGYLLDRNEHAYRALQIEADDGTVTLTGQVRTYYEKQVAGSCLSVVGVSRLINNLTVPEWDTDTNNFPFTL